MSRRQGMFAHARYSEKVFRNLPPKIAQGVQRDIAYVLKKDNPIDVQKWNRALPSQSDIDQDLHSQGAASSSSYQVTRPQQRPRRNVKPKPADLRSEFMSARELFNKDYHSTEESIIPSRLRGSYQATTKDETPTAFKTPENAPAHKRSKRAPATAVAAKEKVFDANVDPNYIAERVRKGLPYLPLRRDDATSYKDAITDILKEAMDNFKKPLDGQVSIGSTGRRTVNENFDPYEALMNKTGRFSISRSQSSLGKSEANESPVISTNELSQFRHDFMNYSYVKEVNDEVVSGAFMGNIPGLFESDIQSPDNNASSQHNFPGDYDSNNIPDEYNGESFDVSAVKTPSFSSQVSSQSLGHQSTLRTPSISETFNNLSNQEIDFDEPQESFEIDDFRLAYNPSRFSQIISGGSSGFLEPSFARRPDPINTTFLQRQQSSRNKSESNLFGYHSRARKRKVEDKEEEESQEIDDEFFTF